MVLNAVVYLAQILSKDRLLLLGAKVHNLKVNLSPVISSKLTPPYHLACMSQSFKVL